MANIYVVGNEGSFTWLATNRRYGRGHKLIGGYTQPSLLVNLAIGKTSRITESAIVPIWNSNSGTIKFDQQKDEDTTAGTLKGDAGQIIDLWGHKISYALGVEGANLAQNGKIYSVAVAKDQCSDFFDRNHELNFLNHDTTNIACDQFLKSKRDGDGILCSAELLKKNRIPPINGEYANPFNYTVFFGFNRHPKRNPSPRISLGCVIMNLEGKNELPVEFVQHWNEITKSKEILKSSNVISMMPRINFILRFEKSKALILMEMKARKDLVSPWLDIAGDSSVKSFGQVGLLKSSFSSETCSLVKGFLRDRRAIFFYGKSGKDRYFWACPDLGISIHGFEADLVKNCAKIQILRLSNLLKEGLPLPDEAKKILEQFDRDENTLKLAAHSKPDDH